MVRKVVMKQVFLRVLWFSSVNIIPPMLHTHLHLHAALTRRTKGRSLGTFQKAMLFAKIGQNLIEENFHLIFKVFTNVVRSKIFVVKNFHK